ncbi:MAG: hypothetical protein WCC43_03115, partial [Pseudolabrys sp.]
MAVFSHRQFLVDRSLNYTCRVSRWTFASYDTSTTAAGSTAPAYRCAATAPSSCTPVVWVVWNNYAYASIRGLQRGYLKGRELATDFHIDRRALQSGLRGDG